MSVTVFYLGGTAFFGYSVVHTHKITLLSSNPTQRSNFMIKINAFPPTVIQVVTHTINCSTLLSPTKILALLLNW